MCDIPDLNAKAPLTVTEFLENVKVSCDKGHALLKEVWLAECGTIVADLREDIESLMPEDEVSYRKIWTFLLKHFVVFFMFSCKPFVFAFFLYFFSFILKLTVDEVTIRIRFIEKYEKYMPFKW